MPTIIAPTNSNTFVGDSKSLKVARLKAFGQIMKKKKSITSVVPTNNPTAN